MHKQLAQSPLGPDDAVLAVETFIAGLESFGEDYPPELTFWKFVHGATHRITKKLDSSRNLDACMLLQEKVGLLYEKVAAAWENELASDAQSQHSADDVDFLLARAVSTRITRAQYTCMSDPRAAEAIIDPAVDIVRRRWPALFRPENLRDPGSVYREVLKDVHTRLHVFMGM